MLTAGSLSINGTNFQLLSWDTSFSAPGRTLCGLSSMQLYFRLAHKTALLFYDLHIRISVF